MFFQISFKKRRDNEFQWSEKKEYRSADELNRPAFNVSQPCLTDAQFTRDTKLSYEHPSSGAAAFGFIEPFGRITSASGTFFRIISVYYDARPVGDRCIDKDVKGFSKEIDRKCFIRRICRE